VQGINLAEEVESSVLDLLCQKFADQAYFLKDLVSSVAMDMEDCTPYIDDEDTPSSSSAPSWSSSIDETSFADTFQNSETSSLTTEGSKNYFHIMELPVEVGLN